MRFQHSRIGEDVDENRFVETFQNHIVQFTVKFQPRENFDVFVCDGCRACFIARGFSSDNRTSASVFT